jgi:hypothetical protein
MKLNLSALSDKELIRYAEGRDLTELEAELVERLRSLDDALAAAQMEYHGGPGASGAGCEVAG